MNADKITRASKSNLALAFVALGRERRRDITIFYAFCRVIDDIADASGPSVSNKQQQLNDWRRFIRAPDHGEPALARDVRAVLEKYRLQPEMLDDIITGVEMDLHKSTYASFAELRVYCYHVASAVGLVSIEIFGYRNEACKDYAVTLGLALQTTNIIRDVRRDLEKDRIYLPEDEMLRFGYSQSELRQKVYNKNFVDLMDFQAGRARQFFARAAEILPAEDHRSMVAAEIMRSVYHALLCRMQSDKFRVFDKDYRLTRLDKAARVLTQLWRSR